MLKFQSFVLQLSSKIEASIFTCISKISKMSTINFMKDVLYFAVCQQSCLLFESKTPALKAAIGICKLWKPEGAAAEALGLH